jgi:hypothetical protein
VPGQHCLLAEGDIGAPIFTSANSSVRLACFQANHLLFGLYKQETKYFEEKTTATLKSKQTSIATAETIFEQLPASGPPSFFIGHYF